MQHYRALMNVYDSLTQSPYFGLGPLSKFVVPKVWSVDSKGSATSSQGIHGYTSVMVNFKFTYFLIKRKTFSIKCFLPSYKHNYIVLVYLIPIWYYYMFWLSTSSIISGRALVHKKSKMGSGLSLFSLRTNALPRWLMLTAKTCSSIEQKPKTHGTTTLDWYKMHSWTMSPKNNVL